VIEDPSGRFRRTRIRKTLTELRRLLRQFAAAAAEMTDPGLPVYPNPSPQTCARCAFVAPCLALSAGDDPAPVLEASYRPLGRPPGAWEPPCWDQGSDRYCGSPR